MVTLPVPGYSLTLETDVYKRQLVALAVVLLWYLRKSMLFSKGNYGKKTVKSILNRYAISRNYKVLENVQLQLDGKTQTIDFVLVGFFGLLFVSCLLYTSRCV